jgi:hypothetical protein
MHQLLDAFEPQLETAREEPRKIDTTMETYCSEQYHKGK